MGGALAARLAGEGHAVWGLKRRPEGLPDGVRPVAADVTDPATLSELPGDLDGAVYAVSADGRDDGAYRRAYVDGPRRLIEALAASSPPERAGSPPARFVFVSSTGVYGDRDGGWVDETTPPEPDRFTGRRLLEGERAVLERASLFPDGAAVVRFGGIYGPGRTRLIDRVRSGEARCPAGTPVYTNRIHRDDCAGFLAHLVTLDRTDLPDPPIYLGVDDEPADLCTVYRWLAARLGAPEPETAPAEATGRRRSNKRCRNDRLRESGYRLLYPTFREGYAELAGLRDSP